MTLREQIVETLYEELEPLRPTHARGAAKELVIQILDDLICKEINGIENPYQFTGPRGTLEQHIEDCAHRAHREAIQAVLELLKGEEK